MISGSKKTIVKCDSMKSFSSIVGNITSFATEFFKGHFPAGFFKKVIISEALNSNVMDEEDIAKYRLPYLVIRPELELDDTFTQILPDFYRNNHYIPKSYMKRDGSYTVFRDEEQQIYIHCIPTRIKITFNCKIRVATAMYMYNVIQYMRNKFIKETYEYINDVHLQSELPKHMMIALAKYNKFDLSNSGDKEEFVNYLNKNSMQGIEENINMGTGNSMYAFNYIVNILSSYPDSPQYSKNTKGLSVDDCMIDFPFSFDLWIPNRFLLEFPDDRVKVEEIYEEDNTGFTFNMVLDVNYILPKIDNMHLILKKSFLPDINVEYDTLNFESILTGGLKKALEFYKKENALTEDIFKVIVMCGNKNLPRELYTVDYENFIIKTMFPMVNTTYTLLVYGDLERLNEVANQEVIKYQTDFRNNDNAYKN